MPTTHDAGNPILEVPKGMVIYTQGTPCTTMFLLREGTVALYLNYHTPQQFELAQISRPGSSLGEMGLFEEYPRSATAVALTDCTLVEIDRENFSPFIAAHPEETVQIILDLSHRFRSAIEEVRSSHSIIVECLAMLKEAQLSKKESLKDRIRKISDYLLDIPEDVPPELYLSFNSRFHGTMF
ncbi:MAG TPA: cyclic nucleotide-binding domain-containing protein [Sphaerochaeta sp.]|jgi:CRP-like cAMP-binding protein|nr:cyclic nucleotide-binding domain-containing protein [Spirochaetota bacterium]NLV60026.1 cyclic nucleotide-binding domain-containing protein [Spirochaetales bacterium]HOE85074.1 cyclic nucleotide-binding domain-containing protein [Sphaerochaeta sp.]HOQ95067.1 cyclic nucleotide-binding domain-containing protein [Sphaerochaeta sp.]HPK47625.1 cyclic nucleotide-binding domain-containing protein [Sphaerochaeta sp.]